MSTRRNGAPQRVAACCLLLVAAVTAAAVAGLRVNTTRSVPVGLYRIAERPVAQDDIVMLCPPDKALFRQAQARDYIGIGPGCEGKLGFIIKRVKALPGDRVTVGHGGVRVNGQFLERSVPASMDGRGRSMPRYVVTDEEILPGEIFVMSDTETGFDGRYFGPLQAVTVKVLEPVLTWGGPA